VFYDFSFQIEANTAKSDLHTQDVHLTHGIIHRVEIGFPAGCRGYAHVAIRHGLHQLWPTNPAGSFNADNYTIVINEYYPLHTAPYRLTLHGWSPGTAYPHTIEIRFGILPVEVLAPEETFIQAFKKLLKRLRL
jgi:hypothetical protein